MHHAAGKGDEVAALLAAVRASAESADEPNALTYRTIRSEANPDEFIIFEEYVMPNGIAEHGESHPGSAAHRPRRIVDLVLTVVAAAVGDGHAVERDAFQALIKADLFAKMDVSYWNEFK